MAYKRQYLHSLCREAPCPWEAVVVLREELEHTVHVPGQKILPTDLYHALEVVDFLHMDV